MKKIILTMVLFCAVCVSALAQNTITMKFSGRNQNNEWIPLSNVLVENQTQNWQEMIYYPDTMITMGSGVGIDDYLQNEKVKLFQNVPNPFDGVTDFALQLDEGQRVLLEIYDVNGKMVAQYENALPQGQHLFRATLTAPQTYLLSAKTENDRLHIKMVNKGNGGENSIAYLGEGGSIQYQLKSDTKDDATHNFAIGDWMKYVGYANLCGTEYESVPVEKSQTQSETVNLVFTLPLAAVTVENATNITSTSARLNGNANGQGCEVTEHGFFYGMTANNLTTKVTASGVGNGDFQTEISNLLPGTHYYYKAYAKTITGMAYSNEISFQTNATLPTITTTSVSSITSMSATSGGNVTADGGASVTARGVCWSTSQNPTTSSSHTSDGFDTGGFTSSMTGLSANTTYYVRAYAINSVGTAYGNQVSFTTLAPTTATVTTDSVSSITSTTAISGGNVTADGGASVTARGVCWSTSQNPTVSNSHTTNGSGTGSFTSSMTGLTAGTTYYVRAYATNSVGTAYGNQVSFTTNALATVTTTSVTSITQNSASSGGNITADGGASVTARGVCWSTSQNPTVSNSHTTNGSGTGSFTSSMTGLTAGTTYYVRAYATNSVGTAYGNQVSFTTNAAPQPCPGAATVTDYDGNTYNTVQIGQQCWMKQNLKTTHYSDGTSISLGNNTSTSTAYRYYPYNSSSNVSTYGYLYNWKAVMRNSSSSSSNPSGVQGICPTGWHVPSDAEWTQLENYVGSQSAYQCGGNSTSIAKALVSTTGWNSSTNTCAVGNTPANNNATGFSAIPAGGYYGVFYSSFGEFAQFWSATQYYSNSAYNRELYYNGAGVSRFYNLDMTYGFSVRCIRNESSVDVPTVTTTSVTSITQNSATSGGNVTADGGASVTARGVCWSTSQNPTVSNSHTTNGSGTGSFTSSMTGLTAGTTYYVRAYATNSAGTAYGEQKSFTTAIPFICGSSTISDYDGNTYNTVQIGNQCWMRENLKTTHYSDGSSIPLRSIDGSMSTAYRYYPNNNSSNVATYGYLYNWKAVMCNSYSSYSNPSGVQGICPVGWHVPSRFEWEQLEYYLISQSAYQCGGNSTNIAKALASTTGWNSSTITCEVGNNPSTNNATGFSAVPAGRYYNSIEYFGDYAFIWSASQGGDYAFAVELGYNSSFCTDHSLQWRHAGCSVRCLRDESTVADGQPCLGAATVTDYDGNTYNTVKMGSQCWMRENLKTTHYSDGTSIPLGSSTSTSTAYRYYPNNSSSNVSTYGYLYNWKAVMHHYFSSSSNPSGVQGICPVGWHVPSDAEWGLLTEYVRNQDNYRCDDSYSNIAKAMASTTGWELYFEGTCVVGYNLSSNNATGFSVVPAGRYPDNYYFSRHAYIWSATQYDSTHVHCRFLGYCYADVKSETYSSDVGNSVRCLRDESATSTTLPTVMTTSVSSITFTSATSGGNVTATGGASVTARGVCWSTSQNPTVSNSHTTNGSGTGSFTSSMTGLTASTTYYVRAYATNSVGTAYGNQVSFTTSAAPVDGQPCPGAATVTDYDGNTYNTVQIGYQCWTKENMRCTTSPRTGTNILETPPESYSYSGKKAYYVNGSFSNTSSYGLLYNWNAAMDTFNTAYGETSTNTSYGNAVFVNVNFSGNRQGICPQGWHVPSDAEWTQLTDYVGSRSAYQCGGNSTNIAKVLASTTGWGSSTTTCAVGNTPANNNATGFSAVPAGFHYYYSYDSHGYGTTFWSATQANSNDAYYRTLGYNAATVNRNYNDKSFGYSVRCLRD